MALTDSTSIWAGQESYEFFRTAFTSRDAVAALTLMPNVKSSIIIKKHAFGNMIQADSSCAWNATGEGTLTEKTLSVCPLKINLSLCTNTWENNWLAERLRAGSNDSQIPDVFEKFILTAAAGQLAGDVEKIVFGGDTAGSPLTYPYSTCDGLVKQMLADSDVVDVNNTTVTSSNVITELNKIINAAPATVEGQSDWVIICSRNIARAYKQAQAAVTGGLFMVGDKELNYLGHRIIPTDGFGADDYAIGAQLSNLFFVTDLVSDPSEIIVINQYPISGIREHRLASNFKVGAGYAIGTEIVLYS